jgi:hypothetical protein
MSHRARLRTVINRRRRGPIEPFTGDPTPGPRRLTFHYERYCWLGSKEQAARSTRFFLKSLSQHIQTQLRARRVTKQMSLSGLSTDCKISTYETFLVTPIEQSAQYPLSSAETMICAGSQSFTAGSVIMRE